MYSCPSRQAFRCPATRSENRMTKRVVSAAAPCCARALDERAAARATPATKSSLRAIVNCISHLRTAGRQDWCALRARFHFCRTLRGLRGLSDPYLRLVFNGHFHRRGDEAEIVCRFVQLQRALLITARRDRHSRTKCDALEATASIRS